MSNNLKLTVCLMVCAAACGYLTYGAFTGTGPTGYLIQLQFALFGVAYPKLALVSGGLLLVPLAIGLRKLMKLPNIEVRAPVLRTEAAFPSGGTPNGYSAWLMRLSWKTVLAYTALAAICAGAAYEFSLYAERREQQQGPAKVDLISGTGFVPQGASLVEVVGFMRPETAVLSSGEGRSQRDEFFAPLAGAASSRRDSVAYFVHFDEGAQPTGGSSQGSPMTFTGRVVRSLPVYVEHEFRARGVRIAPSYVVVDLSNEMPLSSVVLDAGLLMGVTVFLVMFVMRTNKDQILNRRRQLGLY